MIGRGSSDQHGSGGDSRTGAARLIAAALPFLLLLLALVVASTAFADTEEPETTTPEALSPRLIKEAIDSPTVDMGAPATDAQAAQQMPHDDLDRSEALNLLRSVFGAEIESPAGLLDEQPPARYLSDHAAVMSADAVAEAFTRGEEESPQATEGPVLIESSVPLRAEDEEGRKAPVDLSLEHTEGEIQPANPLVETGIPTQLGDGISLANGDVELSFPEAAVERSPSTVEGDAAFYPNVQEDSDLLVAPVPGGVETLTQMRTPQAPRTQTVHVSLPEGAVLKETEPGGVEASLNGRTLLSVAPPSAVDAAGNPVPMTLAVNGNNVEITISPTEDSSFPILADPAWTLENWNWTWGGSSFAGWTPVSYVPSYQPVAYQWGTGIPALDLTSGFPGGATPNTGAQWQFWVPRYQADMVKYGVPPDSYIEAVFTEGMMFTLEGNNAVWPGLVAGILDPAMGWVSNLTWTGANGEISGWSGHANFFNYEETGAKVFVYGLITLENEGQAKYRQAIAAKATTEVTDHNSPAVNSVSIPSEGEWRNAAEVPVSYAVSDAGLGVASLRLWPGEINYPVGCTGAAASPCPREYKSTEPGSAKVSINTAGAAEGLDTYRFSVLDPLWSFGFSEGLVPHIKEENVHLKVDHSSPTVALSGTLTEQGSLGTAKPQYTLKYNAADGTREPATVYTTFGAEGTGNGQFKHPADIALDPSEKLWVADQANNRIEKFGSKGEFAGAYGSLGSGNGQLNAPSGIEADEKGNIWVADTGNNRIEKFGSKGEYLAKFGTAGSGNGQLSSPKGIAIAPNGNIWVADTGNNRIEEFSSSGTFIGAFGAKGSGNLQFGEPSALDIGPGGKVWIADSANNRIEVLNEKGEFLAAYGSLGTGNGQFNRPAGIEVDSRGNVYVLDENNGRVEQLSERGEYLSQFGAKGSGSGQFTFSGAVGLATNTVGEIWVTDSGDNRIEEWNPPKGTRSGVRKVVVKMDGGVVQQASVTCPQGGCPIGGEWLLRSGEFTAGAHTVEVIATDSVELAKTEKLNITLNPPAPSVTLSGTMTEQASLGTELPSYALKLAASAEEGSGVSEAGRSTIATQITIDGKQVDTGSASCSTETCPITREWTLNPREYAAGSHTVIAKATDRYGQATVKEVKITLNPPTPNVTLSGTMTEQASLGTTRPQYKLRLRASDGTLAEASAAEGGPTAAYALDETSGTSAKDAAGNHTGTVTSPTWAEGKYGKALSFNGTSSCLSVPNSVDLQLAGNFTLSAWVKPNNTTQWAPIFYKEAESFYSYSLFFGAFEAGHVQGYVADKPWEYTEVESPGKLTANTWAHVAMTSDGTTLRLYVNGTQVDSGSAKTAMESKQPLLIGCAKNFGEYFNGSIDNVRIFNRALSASEIEGDKASAVKVPAPEGPSAAYALDETSGTSAKDAAGAHTATVSGTASWVEGKYGKALNFNGENTCASVANSSDLQLNGPFTLEAWVKPGNTTQWAPIFYKEGGEFYGYSIFFGAFVAGHIQGYISEHSWEYTEVESPGTLTANAWSHVAMTSDGTTMRLYVNGTQVDTSPASKAIPTTGPLLIGCAKNFNEYFKGAIDNVRVFNRALTAPEVEADKGTAVGTSSGPMQSGIAKTEITLDGKVVDSSTGCAAENCTVTREWTLPSASNTGKHTVVAKATDGYGQWTSKTRTIEIQPDGTKPTLQLGGELAKAPEGWVQQESYGFTATATDAGGYGVTSLIFRIDGVAIASATQPCPEGGCEASISKGISMAPYSGGAHDAEVIATDGAGNVKTEGWTINVDPEGHVTTSEATATLEALEETSESNIVGEPEEEDLDGTVPELGLELTESGFVATGSAVPLTVPTDPEDPITVEIPEAAELFPCQEVPDEEEGGESAEEECVPGSEEDTEELQPIEITPEDVSESSAPSHLVDGNASVSANTESSTDSVVRPLSDGGMIFQAIRDNSAPEDYSFKVELGEEQVLRSVDDTHAEVYYSGHLPAFSIAALPAHDAIGTAVPTTLTVDDRDTVTLHVHYKAGWEGQPFVYPVVGGTGWEGGFRTETVELEVNEELTGEEEEMMEEEELGPYELRITSVLFGPPHLNTGNVVPAGIAKRPGAKPVERPYRFNECHFNLGANTTPPISPPVGHRIKNGESQQCHGALPGIAGDYGSVRWAVDVDGWFEYEWGKRVWLKGRGHCRDWPSNQKIDNEHCIFPVGVEAIKPAKLSVFNQVKMGASVAEAFPICGQLEGVLPTEPKVSKNGEWVYFENWHWAEHILVHESDTCPWGHL